MFLLGGILLAGLFLAPRRRAPGAPAAEAGVPDRPLRILSYSVYHNFQGLDAVIADIQSLQPPADFVLLQDVELEHVLAIARAVGMEETFHPQLYQRRPDAKHWPGICILSRHPLYEGRPLKGGDGATFGVAATCVIEGKRFAVAVVTGDDSSGSMASAKLRGVVEVWKAAGEPPIIIGGNWQSEPGAVLAKGSPGWLLSSTDSFIHSLHWQESGAGTMKGDGGHPPAWIELLPATAPPQAAVPPAPPPPR